MERVGVLDLSFLWRTGQTRPVVDRIWAVLAAGFISPYRQALMSLPDSFVVVSPCPLGPDEWARWEYVRVVSHSIPSVWDGDDAVLYIMHMIQVFAGRQYLVSDSSDLASICSNSRCLFS